mgnify:CR=1 FL=1
MIVSTTTDLAPVEDHPAKFSASVLDQLQACIDAEDQRQVRPLAIFDPFAGTGRVHQLASVHGLRTVGVELEPEWAACHPRTVCGNALHLPFADGALDGMVTSPCYGNRMADAHQANDPCKKCTGGWVPAPGGERAQCKACKGSGLSKRNTYTHRLRVATKDPARSLHADNAGAMRWGPRYRAFHERAYREALRCLRRPADMDDPTGGFVLVNISNHQATKKKGGPTVEHRVVEWTMNVFLLAGCYLVGAYPVGTRRHGEGANRDTRAEAEFVLHFRLPPGSPTLV